MTQIPLGQYAYRRADGLVPSVRLENVFVERSPTALQTGVAVLTRPMLQPFVNLTAGPIRGVFWEKDVFSDDALIAGASTLYRVNQNAAKTSVGALAGSGMVEIAGLGEEALIATGGPLKLTDGVTVTDKAFPHDLDVISVGVLNGYFLGVPANSNHLYYTDLTTGDFDEDRYVAAERYPDNLLKIVVTSDEIWAMGSASVEIYVPTGLDSTDNPPFERVAGRLYKKGLVNTASAVKADNTVFWVGPDEQSKLGVWRGDAVPVEISDENIAERLARADPDEIKVWVFGQAKHIFIVVEMGTEGTWVYDVLTQAWLNWTSYGRDQWRAHTGRGCWPGVVLAGDDETGQVWTLSDTATSDDGEPVVQVFTAGVPVEGRPANSNVTLDCAVGQAAITESPVITLRYSDDQGRTWSDPEEQSLGEIGEYDVEPRWTRLGTMNPPVRIFEWTVADPVRMRVNGARINDVF